MSKDASTAEQRENSRSESAKSCQLFWMKKKLFINYVMRTVTSFGSFLAEKFQFHDAACRQTQITALIPLKDR